MSTWKPNTTGCVPSELREGDVIDIMWADGEIVHNTDPLNWSWSVPKGNHADIMLILAYRLVKKAEPVRETHVAKASLFEPYGDCGWTTGFGHVGTHQFYLQFDTVDGDINYDSMRALVPF